MAGYAAGADRLREFCAWCDAVGIPIITLWVLSTDNLQRAETGELGPLLKVIESLVDSLAANSRWRVQAVGDLDLLPDDMAESLCRAGRTSAKHVGMHINVAVAYGGRHELRDAVRSLLAEEAEKGTRLAELAQTLEIDQIEDHLYTRGQPDPDLIIRTSGEQRISNFLLWQAAYAELLFVETLWPDFNGDTLADAVAGGLDEDSMTLGLAMAVVDEVVTCSEAEIAAAMRDVLLDEHMLVEGAAALALAGFRQIAARCAGQTNVVLLCGGNIDGASVLPSLLG